MSRPKVVYCGEWVRSAITSRSFRVTGHCEICLRMTAGGVWHSIRTGRTRCYKCFDAEHAHFEGEAGI